MGLTTSPIDWYAARAAGIVAYLILTAVVLVGLTLAGQLRLPRWPKFAVADVHRFGGLLAGTFISIHVATIAVDSYTPFSFTQLVVPGGSHYRTVWTALGIVGAELLVALAVTNVLRKRIPYRFWRRIHVLNFAVWGAAAAHGIGSGTDTRSVWMAGLYTISVSAVLAALAWRVARRRVGASTVRGLAGAAGLLGVAAVLGLAATARTHPATRKAVAAPASFTGSFSGSLAQRDGVGGSMLSVVGRASGTRRMLVRIDLVSTGGDGFISDTALQLEDVRTGSVCLGTVSRVGRTGFSGSCSFAGGASRTVAATWRLTGRHVAGSLSVKA